MKIRQLVLTGLLVSALLLPSTAVAACTLTTCATAQVNYSGSFNSITQRWDSIQWHGLGTHGAITGGTGSTTLSWGGAGSCTLGLAGGNCNSFANSAVLINQPRATGSATANTAVIAGFATHTATTSS